MSAAQITILGINAAKPFLDNSEYWSKKGRETVEKIRRKSVSKVYGEDPRDFRDERDRDLRARPRGGFIAERSKSTGDYSDYSSDEDYYRSRGGRGRDRRRSEYRYDAYESEGDAPRNRGTMVKRNDNNNVGAYGAVNERNGAMTNGSKSENNRSDDDDESIMSSSEDEHQEKKKQREKLITGGIATIATLNAAANVYNSMKMREARLKQLAEGSITKDEAKRQRYKHHLQDAAAIGVSAICVKGAYAKWQQTTEKHREHRDHKRERMERRERRVRREAQQRRSESTYDDEPPAYANGDAVQPQRPAYNRAYSRSLDDVRSPTYPQQPKYQYPNYQRGHGRRRGYGDYQGYDDGGYVADGGD